MAKFKQSQIPFLVENYLNKFLKEESGFKASELAGDSVQDIINAAGEGESFAGTLSPEVNRLIQQLREVRTNGDQGFFIMQNALWRALYNWNNVGAFPAYPNLTGSQVYALYQNAAMQGTFVPYVSWIFPNHPNFKATMNSIPGH